jgi:hypothetical protein
VRALPELRRKRKWPLLMALFSPLSVLFTILLKEVSYGFEILHGLLREGLNKNINKIGGIFRGKLLRKFFDFLKMSLIGSKCFETCFV